MVSSRFLSAITVDELCTEGMSSWALKHGSHWQLKLSLVVQPARIPLSQELLQPSKFASWEVQLTQPGGDLYSEKHNLPIEPPVHCGLPECDPSFRDTRLSLQDQL